MEFTDRLEYDLDYYLARQLWEQEYRPNHFFIGLNPRWQMYRFLPAGINVMYSAAGFWNERKKEWRKGKKFRRSFGLRFLDSGGYLMLLKYGHYPFSVVNYANLVARLNPTFYATMDFACEPDLISQESVRLRSVASRIEGTVKNAVKLAEWEGQLPGQMVPVIQGYTIDDYLHCLKLHNEAGTIRDYMAVGSMCRRTDGNEISEIVTQLFYAANRYGVYKLHYFGLKLSPNLEPLEGFIWSRDSAVALDAYDPALRAKRGGRRWPKGQGEKEEAFISFLGRLDALRLNYAST